MPDPDRNSLWLDRARVDWNGRADYFDEYSARNAAGDDRKRELDFVMDALRLRDRSRLLDAGCGPGHFGIAFAQRGCLVDGIDLSPEMIERARVNAAAAGVTIPYSVGDLAALNAPDATYDAIVARLVLQFSPHLSAVLDEFERVARPGAHFWLSVPGALAPMYKDSWQRFVSPEPPAVNYIVPWELNQVLVARGWQLHEQWGSYDNIPSGDNELGGFDMSNLPLPLRQAAATVWNVIVSLNT